MSANSPESLATALDVVTCRICGSPMDLAGERWGKFAQRAFAIAHCQSCHFSCVVDPWLDYEVIYDTNYYEGRGADPNVNYIAAFQNPGRATQQYEWRGVLARLRDLTKVTPDTNWLDYGCGVGGLVQHLRSHGVPRAVGFEQGWGEARLREGRIPYVGLDDLSSHEGAYDVITAIEVIEHAADPKSELSRMRALLKPGGVLFLTTGNAEPYRQRLSRWRYIMPEVHISLFEPGTLALALETSGFEARFPGFGPGWTDLYRAKALRTLGVHEATPLTRVVPWPALARVFDARLHLSNHPYAIARN